MLHRDHTALDRARSFGSSAERYDRVRPGYPAEAAAALAPRGDERVLDVGCGTGKAAVRFTERGCTVLGIEPDEQMAEIARGRALEVECATFEAWEPAGRLFDVIVAAQTWHWVDPAIGPAKAASVLEGNGRLAIWCNYRTPVDEGQRAALFGIYERLAPELIESSPLLGTVDIDDEVDVHRDGIARVGAFAPAGVASYSWDLAYSIGDWADLVRTMSDRQRIGPERLDELVEIQRRELGPELLVRYDTVAIVADRLT